MRAWVPWRTYSNSRRRARPGPGARSACLRSMAWIPGLLVDRQHDRSLGRLTVQRADRVDLLAELRIGAVQPLPNTVRSQVAGLQDALQVAAADLRDHPALDGALNQFVQRRRGSPLRFGGLARQGQQFQPLRGADTPGTARTRHFLQALESLPGQARAPVRHGLHGDAHRLCDRRRRLARMAHQRNLRSNHLSVLGACLGASTTQAILRSSRDSLIACACRPRLMRRSLLSHPFNES